MPLIDIYSGFLGAGKTTLIKKLLKEAYAGEKVVLIENEFGEIGVDGGFLQEAGVEITEMNSGCICCSLVGDFAKALKEVAHKFNPDRIIIEPSGVGKLSDVIKAVKNAEVEGATLNAFCTVVDAKKCKSYLRNFGEFFLDQVKNASCIVLSHTKSAGNKTEEAVKLLREHTDATVITTEWELLSGREILSTMTRENSLHSELTRLEKEHHHHDGECCHHDHEHHHHDGECCHHDHEHHHHDGECCHHDHEHHHHDGECCHHDHEHHHHDGECCHHDHEHHHHHADEVFTSWGVETSKKFTEIGLKEALNALDSGKFGNILRAKGIVDGENGWLYFDYVPEEADVRAGNPAVTGRLCVIGCQLDENALKELFLA